MRKRILALAFHPAFVPPTSGGEARLYNFYCALSQHFDVTLLTSTHIGVNAQTVNHGIGFVEYRIPKDNFFVEQYARLSEFSGGGDLSGPAIAACSQHPTKLHQAFLDHYGDSDIIIYDFPFVAGFDVYAGLDGKPRVYNSHNCEALLYRQLHPSDKSSPIHELVKNSELRLLEIADLVFYCSEADLHAFRELYPSCDFDSAPAPHGLARRAQKEGRILHETGQFVAVFMGSGHNPNVRAAEFIVNILAPLMPEVRFEILGGCLPIGEYAFNVIRRGIVSEAEKSALLLSADVALNPMETGSGSNVKVMDYIAHGLPILSTPFGMRGSDLKAGSDYFEAELDRFAEMLIDLSTGAVPLSVTTSGASQAISRHTWEAIAESVAEKLCKCLEKKKVADPPRYVLALNDYDSFASLGGGGTRTRGLYEALGDWSPVVFVCFSDRGEFGTRKYSEQITVITVPATPEHNAERNELNLMYHVSAEDIVAARNALKNPSLLRIYESLRRFARCVVIEHCFMARLPAAYGDKFVYSSQNNETVLKSHWLAGHPLCSELVNEVEDLERIAVESSVAIIAVSPEDAQSLTAGRHSVAQVIVVRNGAMTPIALSPEKASALSGFAPEGRNVVFLGAAHMPNIEAVDVIVKKIAPKCPDVRFHMVGTATCSIENAPENLKIWGQVDEVLKSAILQSCSLAINPMRSGSGSNVKVSDYIGNGLFVVSTKFGLRGYPETATEHTCFVDLDDFPETIYSLLRNRSLYSAAAKRVRRELFDQQLSMSVLAKRFLELLKGLEVRRKRALFVTYRYTSPFLGGAEVHFEKFVRALGKNGNFEIDVIAPQLSVISNCWRFGEAYSCYDKVEAPIDIPHTRFTRFPLDKPDASRHKRDITRAWHAQPLYERSVCNQLRDKHTNSGFLWGWGYPELDGELTSRWAFVNAGIMVVTGGIVKLIGHSPQEAVVYCRHAESIIAGPQVINGHFEIEFLTSSGVVEILTSALEYEGEPRPLAFRLSRFTVSGAEIIIKEATLFESTLKSLPAHEIFSVLNRACDESRAELGVNLTEGRGPWSSALECYIENNIAEYDLLVTQNNIFRPAVIAITIAKKNRVPSILIPHSHFDDDFYHFPDVKKSAQDASLVLAVPNTACEFLARLGCNVRYLPAGCDAGESFIPSDIEAFQKIHASNVPFILVLGRKASAKGYKKVIHAIDKISERGTNIHVVMIGPDDDGESVQSPNATYLGLQPREVVRGALQSCFALCNMSVSESFGIVLLEAWLAGKPVIANKDCAAFQDIAIDNISALMVSENNIGPAIQLLLDDEQLRNTLAANGKLVAKRFDWNAVCEEFVQTCIDMAL